MLLCPHRAWTREGERAAQGTSKDRAWRQSCLAERRPQELFEQMRDGVGTGSPAENESGLCVRVSTPRTHTPVVSLARGWRNVRAPLPPWLPQWFGGIQTRLGGAHWAGMWGVVLSWDPPVLAPGQVRFLLLALGERGGVQLGSQDTPRGGRSRIASIGGGGGCVE